MSVHNYFRPLAVWPDRFRWDEGDAVSGRPELSTASAAVAPSRASLDVPGPRAFLVSKFGGVSWRVPGHSARETSYGYGSATDMEGFSKAVLALLA